MSHMKTFELILTTNRDFDKALDELEQEFGVGMRGEEMGGYAQEQHAEIHHYTIGGQHA